MNKLKGKLVYDKVRMNIKMRYNN